jgi:hypothetical protein
LHDGSSNGMTECCKLLIAAGCDIHARDLEGETALHGAADGGHEDTVQMLLTSGVPVEAVSKKGRTARDVAEARNFPKIVEIIDAFVHQQVTASSDALESVGGTTAAVDNDEESNTADLETEAEAESAVPATETAGVIDEAGEGEDKKEEEEEEKEEEEDDSDIASMSVDELRDALLDERKRRRALEQQLKTLEKSTIYKELKRAQAALAVEVAAKAGRIQKLRELQQLLAGEEPAAEVVAPEVIPAAEPVEEGPSN